MVVGTTGLDAKEGAVIRRASRLVPIVWSPNMSLGVNVLFALVEEAAATLGLSYDVEITRLITNTKRRAQRTALRLAEKVAAARKQKLRDVAVYGRSGQTGERPTGQIAVHAIRMGDVVGDHTSALPPTAKGWN